MKKILLSISALALVGIVGTGATSAIFSDDEVSTGNNFTAGAVDLTIDNESYYNGAISTSTTWLEARNLDDEEGPSGNGSYLFFNFDDVKPGDWGEDTISLHVNNNDSWLCADVTLRSNDDNGLTEPEGDDGDVTSGVGEGELADAIYFRWWADDGDNVYESDEDLLPAGTLGSLDVNETVTMALADSQTNIWDEEGPLPGDSVRYIGKAWCLGEMGNTPVTQDGEGKTGNNGPLVRGTGFSCNGAPVNNVTQTDSMTLDVAFHAEQARHNDEYVCSPLPQETTITVVKVVNNQFNGTSTVPDFTLFVGSTTVTSGVALTVATGTYQISEQGPAGYNAVFSGDCNAQGQVTVAEFDQAVCTITNNDIAPNPGQLTIDKSVSFSGPTIAGITTTNFPFTVTNNVTNAVTNFVDQVPQNLAPGTYTIAETYTGSSSIQFAATYSGDCTEIGVTDTATLVVASNGVHTCNVLNTITELPQ